MKQYYVYIMTNRGRTLYVGVTNDLRRRVSEHAHPAPGSTSFTARYNITMLVHYEMFSDVREAIAREKQIKGWRREKKLDLVRTGNPMWNDLAATVLE